eukprot:TRINITY_DN7919_c0_g1_i1.p1 TRINITY_DN7919_c0_g1~~TRINITY_DN7919_c0_g1_i1.p1  ORF type:complete len:103 (-),score=27.84 TRINITY_DN7919_c0_g1_i1:40-312(-)
MELHTADTPEAIQRVQRFMDQLVQGCVLIECFNGNLRYSLPSNRFSLSHLFRETEKYRDELLLRDYSISQTTLEQVFISFAKNQFDAGQS